jgi:hypothetical protein
VKPPKAACAEQSGEVRRVASDDASYFNGSELFVDGGPAQI